MSGRASSTRGRILIERRETGWLNGCKLFRDDAWNKRKRPARYRSHHGAGHHVQRRWICLIAGNAHLDLILGRPQCA